VPHVEITDPGDPRLADFRNLIDPDVRPDRRGLVIAEGVNVVERLARSPYRMRAVVGVPARIDELRDALVDIDVPIYRVDKWVLSDVVGFRVTRGVMASADRLAPHEPEALLGSARRLAILEGLNDFENLGALFRNAAAFGVDAVLLDPRCADPLYRRSVRVSMGHVLQVPFAVLRGVWPDSLEVVRAYGFQLLAMTPDPTATAIPNIVTSLRWATMFGAEGPGLSRSALAMADLRVRIPMAAQVDSLNVATAAAVAFAQLSYRSP
jgi:tRNA G18 (ribose-2'-O)-methylase SpoU